MNENEEKKEIDLDLLFTINEQKESKKSSNRFLFTRKLKSHVTMYRRLRLLVCDRLVSSHVVIISIGIYKVNYKL